jgi:hypothetical protein
VGSQRSAADIASSSVCIVNVNCAGGTKQLVSVWRGCCSCHTTTWLLLHERHLALRLPVASCFASLTTLLAPHNIPQVPA